MRIAACNEWVDLSSDSDFVFLTGDLGFMALEPLKQAIGTRFINAGVAEQNMVSVAAGLALERMNPWVYSIAPFCYARPFEQVRNDICQHDLPVKFVGNGGGYGNPHDRDFKLIENDLLNEYITSEQAKKYYNYKK